MSPKRVDFYLLTDEQPQAVLLVACRLLEKAYHRGHTVFVYCDHQDDAHDIDELLWTFKEESFIPHHLQGDGPNPPPPVQIGFGPEPRGFHDILLNLSSTVPTFHEQFQRIIEIVAANEIAKEQSRDHYRTYRAQGLMLHTHKL